MPERTHKGWHARGYLPHLDAGETMQAITFRLADALPAKVVQIWRNELAEASDPQAGQLILRQKIARYEDAGHGSCVLRDAACARFLHDALHHFDGVRYRLIEWCIMPNHVHVLIKTLAGWRLGDIIKSWKIHSSRNINQYMGRRGALWAVDYHDRYIRDEEHLANARSYIRQNPVRAGLCNHAEDWTWSSAGRRDEDGHDP